MEGLDLNNIIDEQDFGLFTDIEDNTPDTGEEKQEKTIIGSRNSDAFAWLPYALLWR